MYVLLPHVRGVFRIRPIGVHVFYRFVNSDGI